MAGQALLEGLDLRNATPADADDVAALLSALGYPCDIPDAMERIGAILGNAGWGYGDGGRRHVVIEYRSGRTGRCSNRIASARSNGQGDGFVGLDGPVHAVVCDESFDIKRS